MTAHDELVRSLTTERFTKHRRITAWHGDEPGEESDVAAWLRLKALREAVVEKPVHSDLSPPAESDRACVMEEI